MSLKSNLSVFVGIPSLSRKDRYDSYISSVLNSIRTQKTDITILEPYITPPHSGIYQHGDRSRLNAITGRMNNIVDRFMTTDATHLFINDGDVETPSHAIDTLIRHNVDVASGVYPFHNFDSVYSMAFGRVTPNDNPCGKIRPRDWDYMKGHVFGEDEQWGGGTGCVLIKRRVFKRHHHKIAPLRFSRDGDCGLDIFFWKRVQDAGFTARVDANVVCGHLPKYPLKYIKSWIRRPIKPDKDT